MSKRLEYKPLLLTTTVRNPERFRDMLSVLKQYDGKVLTNSLCDEICGELIRNGLYKPTKEVSQAMKDKWSTGELLSDKEVRLLLEANPQDHTEAGFDKGWPSRFDTQFKLGMFFGFIYYKIGELIEFSELGNLYIQKSEEDGLSLYTNDEQQVFLNAFVNYHRKNPIQRVLNHNKPLILLLQLLVELEKDKDLGSAGLYIHEIPFLLIWQDADYKALAQTILGFRKKYRFNPSREIVFDEVGKVFGGWVPTKHKIDSITKEYPDELLRKFRLTGLFSLRGNGNILSINKDMADVVDYILKNKTDLKEFDSLRDYFKYASVVDDYLINKAKPKVTGITDEDQDYLLKWVKHFGVDAIKSELMLLSKNRATSNDILKISASPLRLEFLCSLLLKHRFPNAKVVANYSRDDEGLPISHAPGNNPDIELHRELNLDLYEVTLTTGASQAKNEFAPISRHLNDKVKEAKYKQEAIETIMVAPSIHSDFLEWTEFWFAKYGQKMKGLSIKEFVEID